MGKVNACKTIADVKNVDWNGNCKKLSKLEYVAPNKEANKMPSFMVGL